MKVFMHLGDKNPDYRNVMKKHGDFSAGGRLISAKRVVIAEQTHSDLVHVCRESDCGAGFGAHPQIPVADALISNVPGQYLFIRTADCTPVLLHDLRGRAVGAAHSGREGTRKNIAGKTVAAMCSAYGLEPAEIIAWIGAGICRDHYEVDEETWDRYNSSMAEQGFYPNRGKHRHIDVRLGVFQQLLRAGIPFRNIDQHCACTFEDERYFSFRRDGTHNRQINIIGMEHE